MVCLQEIMGRLDDLQKLRALIDIDRKCFKKEIANPNIFKTELEDFFSKLDHNEQLRQTKENTNLHLLSKINTEEPKLQPTQLRKDFSSIKPKIKLDSRESYFSAVKPVGENGSKTSEMSQIIDRSFSPNKNDSSTFKNCASKPKQTFQGKFLNSLIKSLGDSNQNKNNEKVQFDASIRRFMKKVVTRILKRVYLMITTSRLADAIHLKDFSEFNLLQIMEEKLPSEANKKYDLLGLSL